MSRDKNETEDKDCARTLALVHSKSLPLESLSSFVDILIIVTRPCSVATLTTLTQRFASPLQKIAQAQQETSTDRMETIHAYAVPPWAARMQVICDPDKERAIETTNTLEGILIATSSSVKGIELGWEAACGIPGLTIQTKQSPATPSLSAPEWSRIHTRLSWQL